MSCLPPQGEPARLGPHQPAGALCVTRLHVLGRDTDFPPPRKKSRRYSGPVVPLKDVPGSRAPDSSPLHGFSVGHTTRTSNGIPLSEPMRSPGNIVLVGSPEHKRQILSSPPLPTLDPPSPVPGDITLESFYDYFLARSDHSDALHHRLLAGKDEESATLLNTVYIDLAALYAETKTLVKTVHQLAESYWSTHPDLRPPEGHNIQFITPARSAFLEASNREEVRKSSWLPLPPRMLSYLKIWNAKTKNS